MEGWQLAFGRNLSSHPLAGPHRPPFWRGLSLGAQCIGGSARTVGRVQVVPYADPSDIGCRTALHTGFQGWGPAGTGFLGTPVASPYLPPKAQLLPPPAALRRSGPVRDRSGVGKAAPSTPRGWIARRPVPHSRGVIPSAAAPPGHRGMEGALSLRSPRAEGAPRPTPKGQGAGQAIGHRPAPPQRWASCRCFYEPPHRGWCCACCWRSWWGRAAP